MELIQDAGNMAISDDDKSLGTTMEIFSIKILFKPWEGVDGWLWSSGDKKPMRLRYHHVGQLHPSRCWSHQE